MTVSRRIGLPPEFNSGDRVAPGPGAFANLIDSAADTWAPLPTEFDENLQLWRVDAYSTTPGIFTVRVDADGLAATDEYWGFVEFHRIAGWARAPGNLQYDGEDEPLDVVETRRTVEGATLSLGLQAVDADGQPLSGGGQVTPASWPVDDAPEVVTIRRGGFEFVPGDALPNGELALTGRLGAYLGGVDFITHTLDDVDATWTLEVDIADDRVEVILETPEGDDVDLGYREFGSTALFDVSPFVVAIDGDWPQTECGWRLDVDEAGPLHAVEFCVGSLCVEADVPGWYEESTADDCYDD